MGAAAKLAVYPFEKGSAVDDLSEAGRAEAARYSACRLLNCPFILNLNDDFAIATCFY